MKKKPVVLVLVILAVGVALAQPADPEPVPTFVVHTADGKPVKGRLLQLSKDWSVQLGQEQLVPGADVLALRREGKPLPPLPEEAHLILVNGDRIPVTAPRLVEEKLTFRHPALADGKETSVPLSAVSVLWLELPANAEDAEKLRRRLLTEKRKRDRVLLTNGDAVEGVLNGLDANKIEVEADRKMATIDVKQVSAIALSTELADALKPRGVFAQAVLAGNSKSNGSRISLTSATCTDGTILQGTTTFGAAFKIPLEQLTSLDLFQGRAEYVSDLKPSRYDFFPYLDFCWPLVTDGSVVGKDLRVGGGTYTKGLGLHSHSRVTYRLAGGYKRFEAVVGLDSRTGQQGSARIGLLADGKPLDLGDAELQERHPTLGINVSVAGVKELVLEVGFGKRGDVQAHVNWVDARLVK